MYFFFHLLTGIILGFLIADLFHDRRWLLPCAVGAVLPDLIDKPVGFIIFGGVIDNGRIWCHSLLVAAIVLLAGLLVWKVKKTPVLVAAAIGILSHQLLDLMWRQPSTWYYPLAGPFERTMLHGNLFTLLMGEVSNPTEWILAALIAIIIMFLVNPRRITAMIHNNPHRVQGILETGSVLLLVPAGIIIGFGMVRRSLPYIGWIRPEEYFIGGIVIALAAYLLWRWQSRLNVKRSRITH
jgi:membrane-bound metal-dependent hydrolase YbcI (DUF457 family)